MNNQRVEVGPLFSVKNTGDGIIIGGVSTKAIDGLRRKSDEATCLNSLSCCGHMIVAGALQNVIGELFVQAGRLL